MDSIPDLQRAADDDSAGSGQMQARLPGPPRRRIALRVGLVALGLVVLGGALYGFNLYRQRAVAQFFVSNKPPPAPVSVVAAEIADVPRRLLGIGSLTALREVTIATEVAGLVSAIEFRSGQHAEANQVLVRLDDRSEQADLVALRAQQKLAEQTLQRLSTLLSRNATAVANVDQARAQLDQLNANIQRQHVAIDRKVIQAPFPGELGLKQIDIGQYIGPGTAIVSLTDLDRLLVDFTLPEQTRPSLRQGLSVEVRVGAFPQEVFPAELTAIDPQVDQGARAIKLQATMSNPQRRLLPGMFADVAVVLASYRSVIVPETAVVSTLYGDSIYVVRQKDNAGGPPVSAAVERVLVKVGERFSGQAAIQEGLKPGELVVTSGQNRLSDGAAVAVSTTGVPGATAQTPASAPSAAQGASTGAPRP